MIEYGVPILFLAVLFIGLPVGILVAWFFIVRGVTGWFIRRAVRNAVRIGMQERARFHQNTLPMRGAVGGEL